jgi:hypothetical protein
MHLVVTIALPPSEQGEAMTKDEVLKLALEVMRNQGDVSVDEWIATEKAIKEALAQPEQPKVRTGDCLLVGVCASEGHKIQPQRTWVGLTNEETVAIELGLRIPTGYRDAYDLSLRDFAKAIEAKLKKQNT